MNSAGATAFEGLPLRDLVREMRIVRLGEGVDETGRLSDFAVKRTLEAVDEYQELIRKHGADKVRFVATSAMRDAENGGQLVAEVRRRMNVTPEVVPGSEEATLSFTGATATLAGRPPTPVLLVDIGGGSTEFVTGQDSVEASVSVDMGSVRITERFDTRPDNPGGIDEASDWIDSQLDRVSDIVDFSTRASIVGVAGTVTTVAAWALKVPEYSPELTHGAFLSWDEWEEAANFMIYQPTSVKAALPVMPHGREDVIGAGSLIWRQVLRRIRLETEDVGQDLGGAYVSEHDVLDGIALSLLAPGSTPGNG